MKLPKRLEKPERAYLPRRPKRSIRLDAVDAGDLRKFNPAFFCDDCSYFNDKTRACSLGFRAQHTRDEQMALYNLTGKMAHCRAIEID